MRLLYHLSVLFHILAALVWIGSMAFLALVLVPTLRKEGDRKLTSRLLHATGIRLRTVGWVCFGLLIVTGTITLGFRGYRWADLASGELFSGPFGNVLALKLALFLVVVVISLWHDFRQGPMATRELQADPNSERAETFRRRASWIGRWVLLLSLAIVACAVALVRGIPF